MDRARDAVDEQLGIRVYQRLVGPPIDVDPSRGATEGVSDGASGSASASTAAGGEAAAELYFEWCLGPAAVDMPRETVEEAWRAFFRALHASLA